MEDIVKEPPYLFIRIQKNKNVKKVAFTKDDKQLAVVFDNSVAFYSMEGVVEGSPSKKMASKIYTIPDHYGKITFDL